MDVLDTLVVRFHMKGDFVTEGREKSYVGGKDIQTGMRALLSDKEPEIVDLCDDSDKDSDYEADMEGDTSALKGKAVQECDEDERMLVVYHPDSAPLLVCHPLKKKVKTAQLDILDDVFFVVERSNPSDRPAADEGDETPYVDSQYDDSIEEIGSDGEDPAGTRFPSRRSFQPPSAGSRSRNAAGPPFRPRPEERRRRAPCLSPPLVAASLKCSASELKMELEDQGSDPS
uniref:Uncharacterized protein n=1 Tax=Oryza sativa subsp. japonica TaxID=39947 RepID=Q6ZE17_ORYSJ|nr:hypothetical protein [Oryza sativa Japonica Group]